MISAIIENTLVFLDKVIVFLAGTPAYYFFALLGLHILLFILLVTRRKKKKRLKDEKKSSEISSQKDLAAIQEPPEPTEIEKKADDVADGVVDGVAGDVERLVPDPVIGITPEEKTPVVEKEDALAKGEAPTPVQKKAPPTARPSDIESKPPGKTKKEPAIAPTVSKKNKPYVDQSPPEATPEQVIEEPWQPPPPEEPLSEPPQKQPEPHPETAEEKPVGLFTRLKNGLSKTRKFLNTDIDQFFAGRNKIDEELLEDLEELLITADIGVQTAMDLIENISKQSAHITDADQLKNALKSEIQSLLHTDASHISDFSIADSRPHVIMVVGVNGVGKTTTIGKLAAHYRENNQKVLIAAADTFRAAAVEQVKIWADRSQADLVCHQDGSDPAAVAFDGVEAGMARDCDVVIVDTAGRLHTKTNLMEELKKIKRSINKRMDGAPHETLLVLDATTGQNAVTQAEMFHEALDLNGIALTKLDGTAKGGIVISIIKTLNVPLKYIGVGEHIDDLQLFNPEKFVDALF